MKRIKGLPVGLVALFAVVAMGAMGVAYAAWSSTATINGTVNTGTLTSTLTVTNVNGLGVVANENDPSTAGTCTVTSGNGSSAVSVLANNLYPTYSCTLKYTVTNTGSIPATAATPQLTQPSTPGLEVANQNCYASNAPIAASVGTLTCEAQLSFNPAPNEGQGVVGDTFTVSVTLNQAP